MALAMPLNSVVAKDTMSSHITQPNGIVEETAITVDELKQGNIRFTTGESTHLRQDPQRIKDLSLAQNPKCVIVSCSDSRVPPEIIFDQGLGDIFSIRTAGNVMGDYDEGSIEYAVEHLHTPLVIVMGHQKCGAIQALLDSTDELDEDHAETAGNVVKIIEKLAKQEEQQENLHSAHKDSDKAVLANVMNGVKELRTVNPFLKNAYEKGEVQIIGAIYNVDNGTVDFLDY